MTELKTGRHDLATEAEMKAFIKEAEEMVAKYGWESRTVYPFNRPVEINKAIDYLKDYGRCTVGSKQYLITYANGLAKIMNAWEKQEETYIIVRSKKTGKTAKVDPDLADIYLENGFEII